MYRVVTSLLAGLTLMYAASVPGIENNLVMDGSLVTEPCSLDPDTSNVTVDFKTVVDKELYSHSRTAGREFKIDLVDCDPTLGQRVNISFKGEESAALPGLLATTDKTKGIAIGIETEKGEQMEINKSELTYTIDGKSLELIFKGYIQAEPDAIANHQIVLGEFSSIATFELNYP